MDAQLVLERDAAHVVALARLARRIGQELGHDEERDALHPFRCVGRAGEDQMHDVRRQVVLAIGDEDLLAADAVVVALAHGARADRGQVRAGLRLGQAHRAGPLAGDELRQVEPLLRPRAVEQDRLDGTLRQQRAEREAQVRRLPHLLHRGVDQPGQALAAPFGIEGHAVPATLDESAIGLLPAGRGDDNAVLQPRALPVARTVQRGEHAVRELAGFLEHRPDQLGAGVLEARKGLQGAETGHLLEGEADLGGGSVVGGHDRSSRA